MQPYAHFNYIELEHMKFRKKLLLALAIIMTFAMFVLIAWGADWKIGASDQLWSTEFESSFWQFCGYWGIPVSLYFYWLHLEITPGIMLDSNNRICSNCETKVPTYAIMQTCTFDVLGVTDSTQAITSTNAVSGVTSTGGRMGVGVGSIQSTSHVPIKMGRLKFTASCPSCKAVFSWNEDRQVTQWTNPSGQVSYEIVGRVDLP